MLFRCVCFFLFFFYIFFEGKGGYHNLDEELI